MDHAMIGSEPGKLAKLLAVASVAGFCVLPFSPLVSIGAVSLTRGTVGWPRRLAVAGAALCIGYTGAFALGMVYLIGQIAW